MGLIQKPYVGVSLNKNHPLARGLVGCWVMNERTGGMVFDLSGNGNSGTLVGPDWVSNGLNFVATSNDFVGIGTQQLITNVFTICTKVKFDVINDLHILFGKDTTGSRGFNLLKQSNGEYRTVQSGDGSAIAATDSSAYTSTGVWETVCAIYNGVSTLAEIYVNGIKDSALVSGIIPATIYNSSAANRIGQWGSGAYDFDGTMQYMYLYNRTLSAEEAAYLHREPYAMFEQPMSPALLYYEAPSVGWTGIINGISSANIAKINGVPIANIAKVNGIASS